MRVENREEKCVNRVDRITLRGGGGGIQLHCHSISLSPQTGHLRDEGGNSLGVDCLSWEVVPVSDCPLEIMLIF